MLEIKLSAMNHYDNRMATLDHDIAEVRQLAHSFRDRLKAELYEQDRRFSLMDEKVDYEM
jgi:hypothetical protein